MSSDAIIVESVSKRFDIYTNPSDRLKQAILPRILPKKYRRSYSTEFWALKDISLEIKKGQTFGVVGRNGSGKSTLLQLVCGTLFPTNGKIVVDGKIAALLELGAGFNPEFTGRQNVMLSASIYGLTDKQIDQKFDDIAAFADIGQFLDQPVKTYSSGMYIRLAFAVTANVDADILVVDEALSVGDAVFTQKCMKFIRNFKETGTLLFVSHDMGSVLNLCDQAIWLNQGKLTKIGAAKPVSEAYLNFALQEQYGGDVNLQSSNNQALVENEHNVAQLPRETHDVEPQKFELVVKDNLQNARGWATGAGKIETVHLKKLSGDKNDFYVGGEPLRLEISGICDTAIARPIVGFLVRDKLGQDLFGENTLAFTSKSPIAFSAGSKFVAKFEFSLPMLPNGEYAIMSSFADGDRITNIQHHYMHNALILTVSSSRIRYGLVGIEFASVSLSDHS